MAITARASLPFSDTGSANTSTSSGTSGTAAADLSSSATLALRSLVGALDAKRFGRGGVSPLRLTNVTPGREVRTSRSMRSPGRSVGSRSIQST